MPARHLGFEGEFGHYSFKNAVLRNLSPSSDCSAVVAGGGGLGRLERLQEEEEEEGEKRDPLSHGTVLSPPLPQGVVMEHQDFWGGWFSSSA